MKKAFLSLLIFVAANQFILAQSVGVYPATNIVNAGGNGVSLPSAAPANTTSLIVYTTTNFKGLLLVNPVTGMVSITNAHPAGIYNVTVKAFNGALNTSTNFTLTVNNTSCSQGFFIATPVINVGSLPYSIAIGDFNSDGKQDLATTNYSFNSVSIRFGNGLGGFSGNTNIPVGTNPQSIAISDFNNDGKQDIAVSNFISSNVSVLLGDGSGGFIPAINVNVGPYPYAVAIGDFNGDGKQDLATVSYSSNDVSIRLGDGTGNFSVAANVSTGNGPRSLAIGDFNGDGKSDIATANYLENSVSIRLGNGSGGFSGTTNITVGTNPHSVVISDFNNDGKADIATANINAGSISIIMGNGLGNFSTGSEVMVGTNPRAIVTGDFNGDGNQDLATSDYSDNAVSIRLGNGLGGFSGTSSISTGNSPYALAIGNFNSDGKQDIVTANAGSNNVSVLLGSNNDITVQGNNIDIVDGDNSPDLADHTDFGNVSNNLIRIYSIKNTGSANLTINSISLSGTNASLFSIGNISLPVTIASGGIITFTVTFIPTSAGLKTATVNIFNDNCTKATYDFAVKGTGITVLSSLGIYPATVISAAGGNIKVTPDAFPANTSNIAAFTSDRFKGLLLADNATGVITITNAHPAGTYNITVQANGVSTAIRNFVLTVNNTGCSQGLFSGNNNLSIMPAVQSAVIADFNSDGKQDIITANGTNNNVSIRLGDAAGGFTFAGNVSVGLNPKSLCLGDFNADGKQDIAVINSASNDVSIRVGNGSGGFGGTNNVAVGANPLSVATGDFNGDGKQDLATANYNSNNISILLGDGLGNFSGATSVLTGNGPRSIVAADFNNDGKTDLATANDNSNSLSVTLGNGSGGFGASINIPAGMNPYSLVASDFNNDGKQDIAVSNFTDNTVAVYLGDGAGNFTLNTNISIGIGPRSITVGDFNGDGNADIATVISNNNSIAIRIGNGTGNFSGSAVIAVGNDPYSVVVGDINGDGKQDLITANAGSGDISIRSGSSNDIDIKGNNITIADGDNVADPSDFTDFGNVSSSLIRSFSIQNTGLVNLAVNQINITGTDASLFTVGNISLPVILPPGGANNFTVAFIPTSGGLKNSTINILNDNCVKTNYDFALRGTGVLLVPVLGAYSLTSISAGGNILVSPTAAPVNAQNITAYTSARFKGLLSVDAATGTVYVTNAHPAGTYTIFVKVNGVASVVSSFVLTVNNSGCSPGVFTASPPVASGNLPFHVAIGDFNGDGRQDMAATNYSDNTVSIRLGDGLGNFSGSTNVSTGTQPWSVAVGDFNGDGKQDLAIANYGSNTVSIRLGNGLGNFSGNTELPVGIFPAIVTTGDFNNDGKADLATTLIGNNAVAIRFGDGTGNFTGNVNVPVGSGPFSIAISDFNGDGNQDIASVDYNVNTVSINLGNGSGGFTGGATIVNVGVNPYAIASGDFNRDGKQDIATANYNSNNVSIRLGDGAGNFSGITEVSVGNGPGSVTVGDFNGDGKQDIAAANYLNNNISIRFGDGNGGFTGNTNILVGTGPQSLAIGDFNGDGKHDIAIANRGSNNISILLNVDKEINVQGNNITIADGNSTPVAADQTDFGVANNVTKQYNIQNKGNVNLTVSGINITGVNASLFTINGISLPVIIPPGVSVNFQVTFIPTSSGVKTAFVNIINDDCDEAVYDFAVKGQFLCTPVVVNFTGLAGFYCTNSSVATLTGNFSQSAVFTGPGIINNGNGTAIFAPATAGVGTHIIQYVYTDVFGCTNSISKTVIVGATPVVTFTGLASNYFINDPAVTLTGNPLPNGIFAGPGITANGNGLATFNPVMAGAGSHNITYTYTNLSGCSNSSTQQVIVNNTITVNLKLFLQGYYFDGGIMQPVLNNQTVANSLPNETDSITIELHDPTTFALIDSKRRVLLTNGTVSSTFTQPPLSYYLAVKHRNTIQTWSAMPVQCVASTPLYDFTTAANKAMGDNQAEVQTGKWAFYTGDLNQDDFIDGNDFPAFDTDSFNGVNGIYVATDMNGDGFVDGNDFPVFDVNSFNGVSAVHP